MCVNFKQILKKKTICHQKVVFPSAVWVRSTPVSSVIGFYPEIHGDLWAASRIEFQLPTILIWKIRLILLIPVRHRVPVVMRESV